MSIIQKIRDKYAAVAITVIAIAMVGFILIDALSSRTGGGLFGKNQTTVGQVDGDKIEFVSFDNQLKRAEQNYQNQGVPVNEALREQINNTLWKTLVDQKIMQEQADKLGLAFTEKELTALIYGPNPPEFLRQRFTDPRTGQYNVDSVAAYIRRVRRKPADNEERLGLEDYLDNEVVNEALRQKYLYMLAGAAYYPKWLAEKDNQDNSAVANFAYVAIPYALVPDSAAPVSDAAVAAYIQGHKAEWTSTEASRNISYVVFDGEPSGKDSAATLSQLMDLRAGFATTKDASAYLNQNGSTVPFYDGYIAKSILQVPNKDSIMDLPMGGLFGPYLDAAKNSSSGRYVIAKLVDKKEIADSVKCRYILISTRGGQITDSAAKVHADSVATAIQKGSDFKALAALLSDDQNTKTKGGENTFAYSQVYPMTGQAPLPKDFADYLFSAKAGDKKVVKTEVGYIYTEILELKNVEPYFKVAYLAKDLLPSEETTNSANAAATSFAADAQTAGSFEDVARKHNAIIRSGTVKETDYQIQGLGDGRRLVKWSFDSKVGTVSDPESFGNDFVVALVTGAQDAGLPSGSFARTLVENSVRRDLKAKLIMDKLGVTTDLNAAAAKYNVAAQHSDSAGVAFSVTMIPNLGVEPSVLGAIFNKANFNKVSAPVKGNTGVFLVQTQSVTSVPNQNNDYALLRQQMEGMMRNSVGYQALDGLHQAASVTDNRIKFY